MDKSIEYANKTMIRLMFQLRENPQVELIEVELIRAYREGYKDATMRETPPEPEKAA